MCDGCERRDSYQPAIRREPISFLIFIRRFVYFSSCLCKLMNGLVQLINHMCILLMTVEVPIDINLIVAKVPSLFFFPNKALQDINLCFY